MPAHRAGARTLLALGAVLALTVLVYARGLSGPALLDDRHNLGPLAAVDAGALGAWEFVTGAGDGAVFRPVSRSSFLLDWWLWGDDLRAFKAVNLALHLICGTLLFALSRALLAGDGERGSADAVALFIAAAWLLSPLLVSTVLYTVQRMAELAALFTFAGLLGYVRARRAGSTRGALLALGICWPLATLSKENGALLPLLALLTEWWWFNGDGAGWTLRRGLVVVVGVAAAVVAARIALDPQWLIEGYRGRGFTLAERLLTQPRVLLDYLGNLLLLPGASPMGVLRDDYVPSTGLMTPPTTAVALVALAAVAGCALASRRTRFAPVGYGVAFFLAAHAVESGVFPLELYFEHRNYLPGAGVMFSLGAAGRALAAHARPRMMRVPALGMVALCAALTWQRAGIWSSEESLYAHAAAAHPASARAWTGLASVDFAGGRFDEGTADLDRAAALMGDSARAGIALQLIAAHCVSGRGVPEALYRRVESAPSLGGDLYTVNALAWMAGAVASGACVIGQPRRLAQALQRLTPQPLSWDPSRQRLRAAHLHRLLRALRAG